MEKNIQTNLYDVDKPDIITTSWNASNGISTTKQTNDHTYGEKRTRPRHSVGQMEPCKREHDY